jgi:hypothetical protein
VIVIVRLMLSKLFVKRSGFAVKRNIQFKCFSLGIMFDRKVFISQLNDKFDIFNATLDDVSNSPSFSGFIDC